MRVPTTDWQKPIRKGRLYLSVFTIIALLTGCALFDSEIEQPPSAVAIIETRVKARLLEEPELGAAAIAVSGEEKGKVTLEGFVASEEDSQRAERIAKDTDGVTQVVNNIEVKD